MHKYRKVGKQIGEGAHGVVYRAEVLPSLPSLPDEGIRSRDSLTPTKKRARDDPAATTTTSIVATPTISSSSSSSSSSTGSESARQTRYVNGRIVSAEGKEVKEEKIASGATNGEETKQYVAIKKIRMRDAAEGLSMEAIREIKLLQELNHPNVMKVLDVFNHNSNINVVMELMHFDLEAVIKDRDVVLTQGDIKSYMSMLLHAIDHCHKNWVLHRDIKPGNLLIGASGDMKLADFGLGKVFGSPDREMTKGACTLWYRAPELLYGAKYYATGADMWSVGCVFAELMLRVPIFQGEGELAQLGRIFAVLGTPTDSDWENMSLLSDFTPFETRIGRPLSELLPAYSADAIDLLSQLLRFDPAKRPTASEALAHRYFTTPPLATLPAALPKLKAKAKPE